MISTTLDDTASIASVYKLLVTMHSSKDQDFIIPYGRTFAGKVSYFECRIVIQNSRKSFAVALL